MLAVVVQAAIRRHWQARLTWAAMAALSPVLATRIAPTTPVHKSNSTPRDVRSKTRRRSGTRRPRPSMCVVKLRDWLSGCHGLLTAFVTLRDLLLPGMCVGVCVCVCGGVGVWGCGGVGVWVWVWVWVCAWNPGSRGRVTVKATVQAAYQSRTICWVASSGYRSSARPRYALVRVWAWGCNRGAWAW